MGTIKDYKQVENHIVSWLKEKATAAKMSGYVIGVSGGVDSAVVSALCAKTGLNLYALQMPIRQKSEEVSRADKHIKWLKDNYPNVLDYTIDLTSTFDSFLEAQWKVGNVSKQQLTEANTRSRLRMTTLYYYAPLFNCLVVGTGNKVEDFGIKFFTKFGDGACDLSPIGDLMKSEVRALGKHMGVLDELVNAIPTDGLWDDGRGDEFQLKSTYDELEYSMNWIENNPRGFSYTLKEFDELSEREREVLTIYKTRYFANEHKMHMPPICNIPWHLKD